MTAAATTGPARQPRPTSSHPATRWNPQRLMAFSRVRIARIFTIPTPWVVGFGIRELLGFLRGRFLHPRRLALQVAQEVQLRAPDARGTNHIDLGNRRRVQREDTLDALAKRHLPDGERRVGAPAMQADDDALEDLDALLVALPDLHVHAHRVA